MNETYTGSHEKDESGENTVTYTCGCRAGFCQCV